MYMCALLFKASRVIYLFQNNVIAAISVIRVTKIILHISTFNVKKTETMNSCLKKVYKCPMALYAISDNLICSLSTQKVQDVHK